MEQKSKNILDLYLDEHHPDVDIKSEIFQRYYTIASSILEQANFLLFPLEKVVTVADNEMVSDCIFRCDLVVNDKNFQQWVQTYSVEIDWDTLQSFDTLKQVLQLQAPTIYINDMSRSEKEEFCEKVRLWLLTGFELVFWITTSHNVERIWFDPNDKTKFIFNDGILNLNTWRFTPWTYNLIQKTAINLTFPEEEVNKLTLEESLSSLISLKSYISPSDTISSVIIGYMVAGIFRDEYKSLYNEFPFLWIESVRGSGKTSLLNFLSWISWHNRHSIPWTNDSAYAFEVGLNSIIWWFYFFDEIQKATSTLLKYVQAAYNSWENYKWGAGGKRYQVGAYKKDCNLICSGEILPQEEEALLNRFITIDSKEPFLVVKNVRDENEIRKYEELTGNDVSDGYLNTDQIKKLAILYYRPRFLNILKNKDKINFKEYHEKALKIIEAVARWFWDQVPDTRLINNFSAALTGYLIVCWNSVNEEDVAGITAEYFSNLLSYKKDVYISGRIVNYIVENIGEFCSWWAKVKWSSENNPLIYLKNSDREFWLYMRPLGIARYLKYKLESQLNPRHIEQQLREELGCKKNISRYIKAAKWDLTMSGIFIPYETIKDNNSLKRIWDSVLDYYCSHIKELEKIKTDQQYRMPEDTLKNLIDEMNLSYDRSEFFNESDYSKENLEAVKPF